MIDPQDPLPEASWTFRRAFIWLLTAAACGCIWWIVPRVPQVALVEVIKWLIGAIITLATYYLIGPSADHITRLIQMGRTMRAGVVERAAKAIAPRIREEEEAP